MQKYLKVFQLSLRHASKNYKLFVGLGIFLITCLLIFEHLWKIAAAKAGVETFSSEELLWYIALNEWVLIAIPAIDDEIESDLHSGRLAYLLPRPISYLGSCFAQALGELCINLLILGLITFAFTFWKVGSLPFAPWGIGISFLLALAAGSLAILFHMLIGLSSFWLQDIGPCVWVWEKLLFMLGGLMLPLAAYPEWIQAIAYWTPFPAILSERSALALNFSMQQILFLSTMLAVWYAIAILALVSLYRRGLRILNIQGG